MINWIADKVWNWILSDFDKAYFESMCWSWTPWSDLGLYVKKPVSISLDYLDVIRSCVRIEPVKEGR